MLDQEKYYDSVAPRIASSSRQSAFTLIELLVVILIIAILLAIAAPSFLNQQNKAKDSAAEQALAVVRLDAKTIWTNNSGYPVYPLCNNANNGICQDGASANTLLGTIDAAEPEYQFSADTATPTGTGATTTTISVSEPNSNSLVFCTQSKSSTYFCEQSFEGSTSQAQTSHGTAYATGCSASAAVAALSPNGGNGWGNVASCSGTVYSAVTAPTSAGSTSAVISPTSIIQGQQETASASFGGSSSTVSYQWYDCSSNSTTYSPANPSSGCTAISSATSATYTPTATDAEQWLSVLVTAANSGGTATSYATPALVTPLASGLWNFTEDGNDFDLDAGPVDATGTNPTGAYYGQVFDRPEVAKDSNGIVHIRGLDQIATTFANTCYTGCSIGTVPAADDPPVEEIFNGLSEVSGGAYDLVRIELGPSGVLFLFSTETYGTGYSANQGSWQELDDISYPAASDSETTLTPQGVWQGYGGNGADFGGSTVLGGANFYRDSNGIVHLTGLVSTSSAIAAYTSNAVIATLPAADAPSFEVMAEGFCDLTVSGTSHVQPCRVDITTGGQIVLVQSYYLAAGSSGTVLYLSLSGIEFPAGNNSLTWNALSLNSPWTAYPGFGTPAYAEDSSGTVYLQGLIYPTATGWNGDITTLPEGYRPSEFEDGMGAMADDNSSGLLVPRLDIYPTGELDYNYAFNAGGQNNAYSSNSGSAEWLSLDDYSYPDANNSMSWTPLTDPSYWTPYSPASSNTPDATNMNGSAGADLLTSGWTYLGNSSAEKLSSGTAVVWIKTTNTTAGVLQAALVKQAAYGIFTDGNSTGTAAYAAAYNWGGLSLLAPSTKNIADGAWHMLALTFSAAQNQECLWIDGVEQTPCGTFSIGSQSAPLYAGTGADPNGSPAGQLFSGSLAQPRIYSQQLAASQILNLYNANGH
jgi:prepilin-type N-terminal cleavage/methylation domain-containing protein